MLILCKKEKESFIYSKFLNGDLSFIWCLLSVKYIARHDFISSSDNLNFRIRASNTATWWNWRSIPKHSCQSCCCFIPRVFLVLSPFFLAHQMSDLIKNYPSTVFGTDSLLKFRKTLKTLCVVILFYNIK